MIAKSTQIIKSAVVVTLSAALLLFQNCGSNSSGGFSSSTKSSSNSSLDESGPQINLFSKPNPITNQTVANFQLFVSDDRAGVDYTEYSHNEGQWIKINNVLQLKNLVAGQHKVRFRSVDKNGNESDILLYQWIIDLTPPVITLGSKPNTLSHLASFSGNIMEVVFAIAGETKVATQCSANGIMVTCSGNKISLNASIGYHHISIRTQDEAGNVAVATHSWQVTAEPGGLLAPEFITKPEIYDNRSTIVVHIRAPNISDMPSGSNLKCKIDGVVKTPCEPNKDLVFTGLTEKKDSSGALVPRRFRVELNYVGAGTSSSQFDWFVDSTAPSVVVKTKPAAVISTNIIPFKFEVSENSGVSNVTMVCLLDGDPVECLMNQDFNMTVNRSGSHELLVNAVDLAGNMMDRPISIRWENPSCNQADLSLRWPVKGVEGTDWTVVHYVDQDQGYLSVRDFGGQMGSDAKSFDGAARTFVYPGDHKKVFVMSGIHKIGNLQAGDVFAMETGVVKEIVRGHADTSIAGLPANCSTLPAAQKPQENYIRILHDNGYESDYRNLSQNSIPASLVVNSRVVRGQKIGSVGSSGCSTYPRLRFMLKNCQGVVLDPAKVGITTDSGVFKYYTQAVSAKAMVMSLAAHQLPAGRTAPITDAELMSRTLEVNTTRKAKKNRSVTLSYVLSNITKSKTKLQYAIIAPGQTNVDSYTLQDTFFASSSIGVFVNNKTFSFNASGRWGIKIYHIYDEARCNGRQARDNYCTIASIPIDVID